jgi:hypothetical protein
MAMTEVDMQKCPLSLSEQQSEVSLNSTVVVTQEQVSCELAGEAIILNLKSGVYYGLNSVGSRIWALIQKPKVVSEIIDRILNDFDVDRGRCECDLLALLNKLASAELIIINNEKTK